MNEVIHTPQAAPTAADLHQAAHAGFAGARTLTEALEQAYYQRDIEALKRIGALVEYRLAVLSHVQQGPQ